METWLAGFLTDYQVWATFIAALLGFGGVILTLMVQWNLDRALDEARVGGERERLICALTVELMGVREFSQGALEYVDDDSAFLAPKVLPFFVFDGLAQKIDLLSIAQVQSVRHCYAWLREIPARAVLLQPTDAAPPEGYILIPPGKLHILKAWYSALSEYASEALKDLGFKNP